MSICFVVIFGQIYLWLITTFGATEKIEEKKKGKKNCSKYGDFFTFKNNN
jgi:hypothetical protein